MSDMKSSTGCPYERIGGKAAIGTSVRLFDGRGVQRQGTGPFFLGLPQIEAHAVVEILLQPEAA